MTSELLRGMTEYVTDEPDPRDTAEPPDSAGTGRAEHDAAPYRDEWAPDPDWPWTWGCADCPAFGTWARTRAQAQGDADWHRRGDDR